MKRSRSPSPSPSLQQPNRSPAQASSTTHATTAPFDDMACSHLSDAFALLAPPRPSQHVYKDECTLCFDDHDRPNGIDVCLLCFNGACTANGDREHSRLHFQKTGHALVVNVKRSPKPAPRDADGAPQPRSPPKKLAIVAESDADRYQYTTTPRCLACDNRELPRTERLAEVIDAVLSAMASSQQSEVKAWEEEIVACDHTRHLAQPADAHRLELGALASCAKCDLTSNLWLCLTCGHLGCGRAQFGGVGGNGHGLAHFQETGHCVSVKQGTITAEGTADIYCYDCNEARLDPALAQHLAHFGIDVLHQSKTEKSMTELQIEQNFEFDFTMTGDDGKALEPLYGPGYTGLRNLGNSCYLASVVQSLFAIPSFQRRYGDAYRPHTLGCTAAPASCFECQMGKMADGLLSGRYAVPREPDGSVEARTASVAGQADVEWRDPAAGGAGDRVDAATRVFQAGVRPSMFKAVVGKGHAEFATMRQQDADEFFKHLVHVMQVENRRIASCGASFTEQQQVPSEDATDVFAFGLEQRLQCTKCQRVRYTVETQDAGLSLPVPVRRKAKASEASTSKQPVEGVNAPRVEAVARKGEEVEYEAVSLKECLDAFTASEELEYHCPACDEKVTATKRTRFTSLPEVLAVQARRFEMVNWVPTKVEVPIEVPLEAFEMDAYLGKGLQEGEELLPDDVEHAPGGTRAGEVEVDAQGMAQLTAMGFAEARCRKALLATGNRDVEAAMNWLFAHMDDPDIDQPCEVSTASKGAGSEGDETKMLEEMGFSRPQALKALRLNPNSTEAAVAWLFENPNDPGDQPAAHPSVSRSHERKTTAPTKGPVRYEVVSFISHKGPSVHSGHYVAHIKRDAKWALFNDEKVVLAPLSAPEGAKTNDTTGVEALVKLAYVYFFHRV
ncbi:ubiquitin C-terminal hydrolase Ubp14 [Thecaphora frezii]